MYSSTLVTVSLPTFYNQMCARPNVAALCLRLRVKCCVSSRCLFEDNIEQNLWREVYIYIRSMQCVLTAAPLAPFIHGYPRNSRSLQPLPAGSRPINIWVPVFLPGRGQCLHYTMTPLDFSLRRPPSPQTSHPSHLGGRFVFTVKKVRQ